MPLNDYICDTCQKSFQTNKSLKCHIAGSHIQKHGPKKTKECTKCTRQISVCCYEKHLKSCDGTLFYGPHKQNLFQIPMA